MSDLSTPTGPPQPQGPGEDPLLHFTKIFVRFLQLVFATFEKGSYQWSQDLELTEDKQAEMTKPRFDMRTYLGTTYVREVTLRPAE